MKAKRLLVFATLGLLAIAALIFFVSIFLPQIPTITALQGVSRSRMASAVAAFSRDRKLHNVDPTNSVSLQELIAGGYVRAWDVRGLKGRDVRVSLAPEKATASMIWISVREADGSQVGLLGDDSIAFAPKP